MPTMTEPETTAAAALTPAELRRAERAYERAADRAEALREARNALVVRALEDDWTQQQIADATGMSTTRVAQIAERAGIRRRPGRRPGTVARRAEAGES